MDNRARSLAVLTKWMGFLTWIAVWGWLWLLAGPGPPARAEIYKWVDRQGVTHFSNTAPPGSAAATTEKIEEWRHDPEAHAARIEATQAAQQDELQQFRQQKEAARREVEAQQQKAAEQDAREAALKRKIKFEQQRLEGLIHEDRSQEWNAHVRTQLELLAADPETYFEFQLEQEGRLAPEAGPAPDAPEADGEPALGVDLRNRPHAIDPYTGELIPEAGGIGSRGTRYIKSGDGYLNTATGRFFEIP